VPSSLLFCVPLIIIIIIPSGSRHFGILVFDTLL
jgi:hypothetical protein